MKIHLIKNTWELKVILTRAQESGAGLVENCLLQLKNEWREYGPHTQQIFREKPGLAENRQQMRVI